MRLPRGAPGASEQRYSASASPLLRFLSRVPHVVGRFFRDPEFQALYLGRVSVIATGCLLVAAVVPTIVVPMIWPEKYRETQKLARTGPLADREKLQPPGLPVWSNPWTPRDSK